MFGAQGVPARAKEAVSLKARGFWRAPTAEGPYHATRHTKGVEEAGCEADGKTHEQQPLDALPGHRLLRHLPPAPPSLIQLPPLSPF